MLSAITRTLKPFPTIWSLSWWATWRTSRTSFAHRTAIKCLELCCISTLQILFGDPFAKWSCRLGSELWISCCPVSLHSLSPVKSTWFLCVENITAKIVWLHQIVHFNFFPIWEEQFLFWWRESRDDSWIESERKRRKDLKWATAKDKNAYKMFVLGGGLPYADIYIFINPDKCLLPEKD